MSPIQQNDSQICSICIHRLYTNEKELYCRRGFDSNNVMFFCNDYSSETTYENKDYLKFRDKSEYSLRKVQTVFTILGLMLLFGIIILMNKLDDLFSLFLSLGLLVISLGLYLAIYKGKRWAKLIMNFGILCGLFSDMVSLGSNTDASLVNIVRDIVSVLFGAYLFYFFNADKDFVKHFNKQRT